MGVDQIDTGPNAGEADKLDIEKADLNVLQEQSSTTDSSSDPAQDEEDWNFPRRNIVKVAAAYYGFIVFGMSDSSIGVLLPTLEVYYDLSYLVVSTAFLSPFVGYMFAAVCSDFLHRRLGRWGVCILATSLQLLCFIICCTRPRFPAFVIAYGFAGFGNGCLEAAWNSWVGNLKHANQTMGLLHGCYGAGGILCPSIFQAMVAEGIIWNKCYYVLIGMSVLSVTFSTLAFHGDTPKRYRERVASDEEKGSSMSEVVRSKLVWLLSFDLFLYVGGEVGFAGWISTFMIVIRHGNRNKMGFVTTGFWAGLTFGRVFLGFLVGHFHAEEMFVAAYLALALAFLLIIWLVPVLMVSAVFSALFGMVIGPLFPTIVVVALKKLPKRLHVSGVGFSAALGGAGAAILPFVNGVIADKFGPRVLGPLCVSLFGVMLAVWLVVLKWF